jgi:hypothetical protein
VEAAAAVVEVPHGVAEVAVAVVGAPHGEVEVAAVEVVAVVPHGVLLGVHLVTLHNLMEAPVQVLVTLQVPEAHPVTLQALEAHPVTLQALEAHQQVQDQDLDPE